MEIILSTIKKIVPKTIIPTAVDKYDGGLLLQFEIPSEDETLSLVLKNEELYTGYYETDKGWIYRDKVDSLDKLQEALETLDPDYDGLTGWSDITGKRIEDE